MIKLRKFRYFNDTTAVAKLIRSTFRQFSKEKDECVYGGAKKYFNLYNKPQKELLKNFRRSPIFFVAVDNKKIVGLIRGNKGRIINFYVYKRYQGKGIGFMLIKKFEVECKKQKSNLIKVRASLFSVSIYQKFGYKKTTGSRKYQRMGLILQPMQKLFK